MRTISISRSSDGWPIQWKSARRFRASCSSRVRFEVRITAGRRRAEIVPSSGNRDLEVREHLEQERLELLVGPVDLVDQQDDRLVAVDRLEQRPPDQVLRPEELLLADGAFLRGADVEQLPRVVPLVDGMRDVEALVALEPDQARPEDGREGFRRLGLPDPGLALEEHGLREDEREVERGREPPLGQVVGVPEGTLELVDRAELHAPSVDEASPSETAYDRPMRWVGR